MEDTRFIDMYTVGVGLEYYGDNTHYLKANDEIDIDMSNHILKDGIIYGSVAKQDKYYASGYNILKTLINCDTYQLHSDDYIFCSSQDITDLLRYGDENETVPGRIIYADDKKAIIYLGVIPESDLYDEDDNLYNDYTMLNDELMHPKVELTYSYDDCNHFSIIADNNIISLTEDRKEDNNMENIFGRMGFGKCSDSRFALSMNGIAVRQAGCDKFVVYNKDTNEFTDVTDMLINIKDSLFILPAIEVKVGDTVLHEGKPYYIVNTANNEIKAVSYDDCTQTILIPKTTMFGLKYFRKVFSLFGDNFANTGEMFKNPMVLMALMGNDDNDLTNLLLMSNIGNFDFTQNPMLMTLLLKKDGNSDLSNLLMLSALNGNNIFNPKKEAKHASKE